MAFTLADRVKETATTTGTGDFTLAGAVTGYQTFDAPLATGDGTYYCIEAVDGSGVPTGDWEVGIGTFTSPSTLARTTVLASSNAGALVSFAAGTKYVFIPLPAYGATTLYSNDAGASAGPILTLYRDSASPAGSDVIGQVIFSGEDSAGNQQTYATIQSTITDATSASEDGRLVFSVVTTGTLADELLLDGTYLRPSSNGGLQLGLVSTNEWAGLALQQGTAITWGNSLVTLTGNSDDVTVAGGTIIAAAGTTTVAPVKFQSGTNLTTAEVGALEYDGTCLYGTVDAGNRGVIPCINLRYVTASTALTNTTNDQQLFPTNGVLTLEAGVYYWKSKFVLTGMSATSGNTSFSPIGAGTATATHLWTTWGEDAALNPATATAFDGGSYSDATSGASLTVAATATSVTCQAEGVITISVAGTIIPTINLVTAAAASLAEGSMFMTFRMGAVASTAIGQWS